MIVCHTQEDADLLRCLRAHGYVTDSRLLLCLM